MFSILMWFRSIVCIPALTASLRHSMRLHTSLREFAKVRLQAAIVPSDGQPEGIGPGSQFLVCRQLVNKPATFHSGSMRYSEPASLFVCRSVAIHIVPSSKVY